MLSQPASAKMIFLSTVSLPHADKKSIGIIINNDNKTRVNLNLLVLTKYITSLLLSITLYLFGIYIYTSRLVSPSIKALQPLQTKQNDRSVNFYHNLLALLFFIIKTLLHNGRELTCYFKIGLCCFFNCFLNSTISRVIVAAWIGSLCAIFASNFVFSAI